MDYQEGGGGIGVVAILIYLAIVVLMIASAWKIFVKAGKPGWAAIVPIYNIIVFLEIIGRPLWWIVLCLIPIVNFVILIIISLDLAACFGKSKGWGFLMLCIVPFIGYPLLAFSDVKYSAPAKS